MRFQFSPLVGLAAFNLLVSAATVPSARLSSDDNGVHFDLQVDGDADVDVDIHVHVNHDHGQIPLAQTNDLSTQPVVTAGDDQVPVVSGSSSDHSYEITVGKPETAHDDGSTPPPVQSLHPAAHPDVDTSDKDNLKATMNHALYYEDPDGDASANITFGIVEVPGMKYPTVLLEHTIHVSISCSASDSMTVVFSDREAFDIAATDWKLHTEGFLLVTFHDGCGAGKSTGERSFHLVTSLSIMEGGLTVVLSTSVIAWTDAVPPTQDVTISVGSYVPGSNTFTVVGGDGSITFTRRPGSYSSGGASPVPEGVSSADLKCATTTDFDVKLDCQIGFMDPDNLDINQLLPGIDGDSPSDYTKRELSKRGFFSALKNAWNKASTAVVSTAKATFEQAKQVASTAVNVAVNYVKDLTAGNFDKTDDINLNLIPSKNQEMSEKWGTVNRIYETTTTTKKGNGKFGVYCVGCGVEGKLTYHARLVYNAVDFIKEAYVEADGNAKVNLALGIIGQYEKEFGPYKYAFPKATLSPLQIPGIINIGPSVDFELGTKANVAFNGDLLAGTSLVWERVRVVMDFGNPGRNVANGWTPKIIPKFEANGDVALEVTLFSNFNLTLSVAVLPNLKPPFKQEIGASLVDTPSITLKAAASVHAELVNGSLAAKFGNEDCAGIQAGIDFMNDLNLNLLIPFVGPKEYSLWSTGAIPLAAKCYPLPSYTSKKLIPRTLPPSPDPILNSTSSNEADGGNKNAMRAKDFWADRRKATSVKPRAQDDKSTSSPPIYKESKAEAHSWQITSSDFAFNVVWAANGNLLAIDSDEDLEHFGITEHQSEFVDFGDGLISAAADNRVIHGYKDTLDNLGVSRLRLANTESIPKTSVIIGLDTFYSDGDDPDPSDSNSEDDLPIVLATTTKGDMYYPIVCVYKADDMFAKLFIAKDPEEGAKTLMREDLKKSVTGGEVEMCGYVELTASG